MFRINNIEVDWLELMRRWSTRGGCNKCGNYHLGPIVKEDVWRIISLHCGRHTLLCRGCMEGYLSHWQGSVRRLTEDDLIDIPWNTLRKEYILSVLNISAEERKEPRS